MTDRFWHEQQDEFSRALKVTPGGGQTRSRAPGHVGPADTREMFPLYATSASGAYVVSGRRRFLDCFGANAAVPLGHAYGPVNDAVWTALGQGNLPSLASYREREVSEQFLETCCQWWKAEQVRWVKTGTEALMAAVRLARAATGRDKIVVMDSSYHGWSDLNDARFRNRGQANGVPEATAALTIEMPYHEKNLYDYIGTDVAAVLVEPNRWVKTDRHWLAELVSVAHERGALVIFDEMVYGLRWATGGSVEYYAVSPDLACFGKALGNGVPVANVCGSRHLMAESGRFVSGTYSGDLLGLSAASAVLREYRLRDVIGELWENGRLMREAFDAETDGIDPSLASMDGTFVHWRLLMADQAKLDAVQVAVASYGVLFSKSSNNASAAMTPAEAAWAGRTIGAEVRRAL